MSKKNLATTTLIAAGLLIASVPVLANDHLDHRPDRSSNAAVTASQSRQRESGSERRADRPDREQRENVYGGPITALSMKSSRSSAKSTVIPVLRNESRENNHN